jgi:hypothetical protein
MKFFRVGLVTFGFVESACRYAMKFILLLLLLLSTSVSRAVDLGSGHTLMGFGNNSCGTWTDERRRNVSAGAHSWVLGFLTAYNLYEHDAGNVSKGTDAKGLFAWIDNYCRDNPLENLETATVRLIEYLTRSRNQ